MAPRSCAMPQRSAALLLTLSSLPFSVASVLRGKSPADSALVQSDEGGWADDAQPTCSCDCCDVVKRLPGETAFNVGTKCAPGAQHASDKCGAQCSPGEDDKILK